MLRVYEFEIFPGEDGWSIAVPYDMEGATQGRDFGEACFMAADWLQGEMEYRALYELPVPEPTFGNEPTRGGKTVIVAVKAGRDTVDKVSASEAARMLGVTPGRVTQMIAANRLLGYKEGHRTWVTLDSVKARLAEAPRAGRPRKSTEKVASA